MVVLGGEFILLLFIGVMAVVCWSELRGGCFWEVYNGLVLCLNQLRHLVWLLSRGWLLFRGVVTVHFRQQTWSNEELVVLSFLIFLQIVISYCWIPCLNTSQLAIHYINIQFITYQVEKRI